MFRSTKTGFQIDFPNGWTASVQWGAATNSDNKMARGNEPTLESSNAEVWAVETQGVGIYPQDPMGYQSVPQVLAFLNEVSLLGVPEFIKKKTFT